MVIGNAIVSDVTARKDQKKATTEFKVVGIFFGWNIFVQKYKICGCKSPIFEKISEIFEHSYLIRLKFEQLVARQKSVQLSAPV